MTESISNAHPLKSCLVWQGVVALRDIFFEISISCKPHPKLINAKPVRMKAVRISLAFSSISLKNQRQQEKRIFSASN